jgi:hypothetical protein
MKKDELGFEGLRELDVTVTMASGRKFKGIVDCCFDDALVLYSENVKDRENELGDTILYAKYVVSVEINEPTYPKHKIRRNYSERFYPTKEESADEGKG